jgi:SAM-dependent methyltransferase
MTSNLMETYSPQLQDALARLQIALPAPGDALEQDEEWVVVNTGGRWRKVRLHDYGDVYAVPGLYEKWIYDLFRCRSPQKVADLLIPAVRKAGLSPADLTVLDLGAGNGYVADVLRDRGIDRFVGIDIFKEAADAAERDRPGLYDDYIVGDLTNLEPEHESVMARYDFNCMTCVAALGFGDIPPAVFAEAFNRVENGGWAAFTIKRDFVCERDKSGFSRLIRRMLDEGVMNVSAREPFTHRVSTDGEELIYEAFIGRKDRAIPADWVEDE